jgi:hypothetical protein
MKSTFLISSFLDYSRRRVSSGDLYPSTGKVSTIGIFKELVIIHVY